MKLENKSIVVTGASSGMGKCVVETFVREGANVVAVARRAERLAALAESLKDAPGKLVTYVGDVSKREDCEGMIAKAVECFGRLDVLVNNAGVMDDMATIANCTDEKYDYVMGINVYGPLAATRKAVQVFPWSRVTAAISSPSPPSAPSIRPPAPFTARPRPRSTP